jgi:hypothetical protein
MYVLLRLLLELPAFRLDLLVKLVLLPLVLLLRDEEVAPVVGAGELLVGVAITRPVIEAELRRRAPMAALFAILPRLFRQSHHSGGAKMWSWVI